MPNPTHQPFSHQPPQFAQQSLPAFPTDPLAPPTPRTPLSGSAIACIAMGIVLVLAIAGVVLGQISAGL